LQTDSGRRLLLSLAFFFHIVKRDALSLDSQMFTLDPGANGGADGSSSPVRQQLWNFAQLGLYFAVLRGAFVFFSSREKALKQ
jgi:hypothetical protein